MKRDIEKEAEYLIERELKPEGITDERVVAAMYKVKREKFIPESLRDRAYGNYPLPIGENQTISHLPSFLWLSTSPLSVLRYSRIPMPLERRRCQSMK